MVCEPDLADSDVEDLITIGKCRRRSGLELHLVSNPLGSATLPGLFDEIRGDINSETLDAELSDEVFE